MTAAPEPHIARGLEGIAITETRLSCVDGQAGRLVIGGFPVEDLAPKASFEETLFLLWHDRLPDAAERADLESSLAARRSLPPATLALLRAAADAATAPMDALAMGLASLGLGDPGLLRTQLHTEPPRANRERALSLVAAVPAIVGAFERLRRGLVPVSADPSLDHAAAYLHAIDGAPPSASRARALATYLNTTVDHGMNASTFTARVIASTRSDMRSAIAGALGALKGPLHGGAPGPALEMVVALRERAKGEGRSIEAVAREWAHERVDAGERIMGFGHRVYRVRDPRADVLGAAAQSLEAGDLIEPARAVERVVLEVLSERKPGRRLETNVEFYTALLLHGIGLPADLFTPTFAVARVGGWTAHVLEQIAEDRLIRPRVVYVGDRDRRFLPIERRA
jgi:citrate synthase